MVDNKFKLEDVYIGMQIKDKNQLSSITIRGLCLLKAMIQTYIQ